MRKVMLIVLVLGLVGGVLVIQRYLAGESAAREVRERARNFPSLLQGAAGSGSVSRHTVRQIVLDMARGVDGVKLKEQDIEIIAVPIPVGEGNLECPMPTMPPEFKNLSTLDQGNVRNLAIRCKRGLTVVGFRGRARGPTGDRFQLEGWSYATDFAG